MRPRRTKRKPKTTTKTPAKDSGTRVSALAWDESEQHPHHGDYHDGADDDPAHGTSRSVRLAAVESLPSARTSFRPARNAGNDGGQGLRNR